MSAFVLLLVIAAILFTLSAFNVNSGPVNLVPLGLALATVAAILRSGII